MIWTELTLKAFQIAEHVHFGQVDKAGKRYIFHPLHVAEQMQNETSTCVALLHDVVEDNSISFAALAENGIPGNVIKSLRLLTHDKNTSYMDYIRAIKKDPIATLVKIADLEHNSDLSRLDVVTEKDVERVLKYNDALRLLRGD